MKQIEGTQKSKRVEQEVNRDAKKKALEVTLAQIDKQYGNGAVMLLGQAAQKIDVISTGSILIDQALGVGGFPVGRIIEIFGPEATGKTPQAGEQAQ